MSDSKRAVLATLGPTWVLEPSDMGDVPFSQKGLERVFGRAAPVMLDIGVGTGSATLARATEHPDHDVVAIELHRPGVAMLIQAGHTAGLSNIRVIEADVTQLIAPPPSRAGTDEAAHTDPPATIDHVRVLFPDPWPKKRHVRRRLIDATFVRQVTDLMVVGGIFHVATDWPPYADQIRAAIDTEPRLEPQTDLFDGDETSWRSHRPDRPVTPYEQRGIDAGRPITDLITRRRAR